MTLKAGHPYSEEWEDNVKAHILCGRHLRKEDKRGKGLNKFSGAVLPGGGAAGKEYRGEDDPAVTRSLNP